MSKETKPSMIPSLKDHSAASLRYLDSLRTNLNVTSVVQEDSNVVQVSVNGDEDVRVCHLTSLLPSTSDNKGTLQLDYGLYTEGAGLLALLHFNQRNTSVVPDLNRLQNCNVQLTMSFENTQFSPIEACRVLSQEIVPFGRPHSLKNPRPISIVGATRSAVTAPLATLASVYELPVVSYGATSSQLNQRDSYPYFARTVPTNQGDALAAASYFRHVLGVTHMGALFVKDPYGSAFHQEFVEAAKALDPPMHLISSPYNPDDGEEAMKRAMQMLLDSGYSFFFGVISTPTYDAVMRQAYQVGLAGHPGKTWIHSQGSGQILGTTYSYDAETEGDLAAATSGAGVISLDIADNPAFNHAWSLLEGNPAIKEFFLDKHDPQLNFSDFRFYDKPTYWEYLEYDAVMALGFAACEAPSQFFSGSELYDNLIKTTFRGASGQVEFDAATGTRKTTSMSYKITNVVARAAQNGSIYFDAADIMRQDPTSNSTWTRIPGSPSYVYSDGSTTQPPGLPPLQYEMNLIGTPALIAGLMLAAVFISLSIACAAWTYYRRSSQVVRDSQPFFLLLLCSGTVLMAFSIVPTSFQEPMRQSVLDASCMASPWMFSSGFVIAFSALFSKTLRIYRLLHRGHSFRRVVVNVQDVLRPFLGLATINIGILATWNIVSPLRWTRIEMGSYDEYGRSTQSFGTCQSDNQTLQTIFLVCLLGVDMVALVAANILNYKARKISATFHEAASIAFSMIILVEIVLIGAPALLVVQETPPAFFVIRSAVVATVCGALLLPIFLPKWRASGANRDTSASGLKNQLVSELVQRSYRQGQGSVAIIRAQVSSFESPSSKNLNRVRPFSSSTRRTESTAPFRKTQGSDELDGEQRIPPGTDRAPLQSLFEDEIDQSEDE